MSDSRVWGDLSKRRFMAWHLRIILNYWFQKIKSGGLGKTCVLLNGGEMELVRGRYPPPDTPPNKAATSECCGSHGKQNTEEFHSNRNLRRRNKLIPQKHQLACTPTPLTNRSRRKVMIGLCGSAKLLSACERASMIIK